MNPKKQRKRKRYIVYVQAGDSLLPCRLATRQETGLGPELSWKRGLLVPAVNAEPHVFAGERSARRVTMKTIAARRRLCGSMVDQHPKLQPLLNTSGVFSIKTVKQ